MPQVLGQDYTVFRNNYLKAMTQIRESELTPPNIPFIMNAIIEGFEGSKDARKDFVFKENSTIDGIAVPRQNSESSGRFKVVTNSELLRNAQLGSVLLIGSLQLPSDEAYATMAGTEFVLISDFYRKMGTATSIPQRTIVFAVRSDKYEKGKSYSLEELYELGATPLSGVLDSKRIRPLEIVKVGGKEVNEGLNSDLLLALSHYNLQEDENHPENSAARELRDKFVDAVFREVKKRGYDYNPSGIPIDFHPEQRYPVLTAWVIRDIKNGCGFDTRSLDSKTRLVGIGESPSEPLVKAYTPEDVHAASEALERLRQQIGTNNEDIASLEALLRKLAKK